MGEGFLFYNVDRRQKARQDASFCCSSCLKDRDMLGLMEHIVASEPGWTMGDRILMLGDYRIVYLSLGKVYYGSVNFEVNSINLHGENLTAALDLGNLLQLRFGH